MRARCAVQRENALQPPFRRTGWWSAFPRRGTCGLPAVRRWMSLAWRRLSRLGLTPQDVEKPVGELSGGQRRRVALLRALLAPADVVVLDEPFKGLDEAARQAAAAYVRRMQAGRTLLCITHEEGDAALLGARVFRLPEAAEQQEGR